MNRVLSLLSLLAWGLNACVCPVLAGEQVEKVSRERLEYSIAWKGIPVGTAVVENELSQAGGSNSIFRSIRVTCRPWLKLFHPVNDLIECIGTDSRARSRFSVHKFINEAGFHQDDVLTVDSGNAVWTDTLSGREAHYPAPAEAKDYLSFLFDIRSTGFSFGVPREYQLVMDEGVRRLSVASVCTGTVECAWGVVPARKLEIKSLSSQLFVRNVPRAVWISEERPVMLVMEASTKLGAVRAVLQKWESNGQNMTGWPGVKQ